MATALVDNVKLICPYKRKEQKGKLCNEELSIENVRTIISSLVQVAFFSLPFGLCSLHLF